MSVQATFALKNDLLICRLLTTFRSIQIIIIRYKTDPIIPKSHNISKKSLCAETTFSAEKATHCRSITPLKPIPNNFPNYLISNSSTSRSHKCRHDRFLHRRIHFLFSQKKTTITTVEISKSPNKGQCDQNARYRFENTITIFSFNIIIVYKQYPHTKQYKKCRSFKRKHRNKRTQCKRISIFLPL